MEYTGLAPGVNLPASPAAQRVYYESIMLTRRLIPVLLVALASACSEAPPPPGFGDLVPLVSPSGTDSEGPRLSAADGRLVLSWMERTRPGGALYYSELGGDGWGDPQLVVTDPAMFVNWADLPSVVPIADDRWFAHWLSFSADGPYSYDVRVALGDGRRPEWGPAFSPHDDGTPTEHGFVSTIPLDGRTGVIWLDGRNTLATPADEAGGHDGHTGGGGMTLRAATIDATGAVGGEQLIDDLVCDCCQTDIAVAAYGPIAVYRNRTHEEIRDIFLSRYRDGAWQPGERFSFDNWEISGCPVNGPSIAAHGDLVAVAWFTGAGGKPMLKLRLSVDGGKTFGERRILSQNRVRGHADAVAVDGHSVVVSWLEAGDQDLADIRVRSVSADGTFGPIETVGRTALARVVPQLALIGDELVLAWTDDLRGERRISSIIVPILPGPVD